MDILLKSLFEVYFPLDTSHVIQMTLFSIVLLVCLLGCTMLISLRDTNRNRTNKTERRQPPLPPLLKGCIPFLGNLFAIDRKRPHLSLTECARTYGPIFRFRIMGEDIVVLNSKDLIREALVLQSERFAGRPSFFRVHYGFHYQRDIIFTSYDKKWLSMKRLAGQALRQFSQGQAHVEDMVHDEMKDLVELFEKSGGRNFDPSLACLTAVTNAITAMALGKRFPHNSPQMIKYKLTTRLFSRACSAVEGIELDLFPWLRFIPNPSFRRLEEARRYLDKWVDEELREAKAKYKPESPRCFVDLLFKESEATKDQPADLKVTAADIRTTFVDLLVSGTLTTSIALNTLLMLCVHYPKQQAILQQEIDTVIGRERRADRMDRLRMPRTEAAILEVMRYLSHVPLCLPHYTLEAADIGGHRIPKHTQVLLNLWALHHDPDVYPDPWSFQPHRFLDRHGQLVSHTHPTRASLLPFGAGRRMCVGEQLARGRIFLFLVAILQRFTLHSPEGETLPSCDPREFDMGLILEPLPFKIRAVRR